MIDIEFVTASHNEVTLHGQLKRSKIFRRPDYALTVKTGFANIPEAYNSLGPISDITCYLHHDVFMPDDFEFHLQTSLKSISAVDPKWGVLGVAGVRLDHSQKQNFGFILDRGKIWGHPMSVPAPVDTLDELMLITKGDFEFDEQFPFDFYGADICMQARDQGRKCYAINAYCEHNSSRKLGERTPSFFESQKKFREKWKKYLPIATTCSLVS